MAKNKSKYNFSDIILTIIVVAVLAFIASAPYNLSQLHSFGWKSNEVCCFSDLAEKKFFWSYFIIFPLAIFFLEKTKLKQRSKKIFLSLAFFALIGISASSGLIKSYLIKKNPTADTTITFNDGEKIQVKKILEIGNDILGLECGTIYPDHCVAVLYNKDNVVLATNYNKEYHGHIPKEELDELQVIKEIWISNGLDGHLNRRIEIKD